MKEIDIASEVCNAAREMERILNALEIRVGRIVREIRIDKIEVSTMFSTDREFVRSVMIELELPSPLGQIGHVPPRPMPAPAPQGRPVVPAPPDSWGKPL